MIPWVYLHIIWLLTWNMVSYFASCLIFIPFYLCSVFFFFFYSLAEFFFFKLKFISPIVYYLYHFKTLYSFSYCLKYILIILNLYLIISYYFFSRIWTLQECISNSTFHPFLLFWHSSLLHVICIYLNRLFCFIFFRSNI